MIPFIRSCRRFASAAAQSRPEVGVEQRAEWVQAVLTGNYEQLKKSAQEGPGIDFVASQCAERAFLMYTHFQDQRKEAMDEASAGNHFALHWDKQTSSIALPTLWAPVVYDEFQRSDAILKLIEGTHHLKPGSLGAREHQLLGRVVVSRLLCGRIASVLQSYMSLKMLNQFNPQVFESHMRATKNFEQNLASTGPYGPLEQAAENTFTQEQFVNWAIKREEAVNTQLKYMSHVISEVARNNLPRDDAINFLNIAIDFYKQEVRDRKTKQKAIEVFENTQDAI